MQLLGFVVAILSIMWMLVAFLPFLGSMNWIVIPFTIVGLAISIVGIAAAKKSKGLNLAAIVLCCIVIVVGAIRLNIGGGFF